MVLKWVDSVHMDYHCRSWRAKCWEHKNSFPKFSPGEWKNTQMERSRTKRLISLPGKMGKSRMLSCLGMLLVSGFSYLTVQEEKNKHFEWLYRTVNVHLIWYPGLYSAQKLVSGKTGQMDCPFLGNSTGSGQAPFQQELQRKLLCLQLSFIHLYNPSLETSVSLAS